MTVRESRLESKQADCGGYGELEEIRHTNECRRACNAVLLSRQAFGFRNFENYRSIWRARQESNLYLELRRLLFYPLNYGREARYCSVFAAKNSGGEPKAEPASSTLTVKTLHSPGSLAIIADYVLDQAGLGARPKRAAQPLPGMR